MTGGGLNLPVVVVVDKSASATARHYKFGTVWNLGGRIACEWAKAGPITFIPFSASFSVYPKSSLAQVVDAIGREIPGQATRLSNVLRFVFDDYILRSLARGTQPEKLIVVCDGEPDDIEQTHLEILQFLGRKPKSSPYFIEIITQTEWVEIAEAFKRYSSAGSFQGMVFNTTPFYEERTR